MGNTEKTILVTGDQVIDRFIYVEGFGDTPPNLREAWVEAQQFWTENLKGGAGALVAYLNALGLEAADPFGKIKNPGESIYAITRQGDNQRRQWRTGLAMVCGERPVPCVKMGPLDQKQYPLTSPAVFLDFKQGCLESNMEHVLPFLTGRPYLVRTHDPRRAEWRNFREQGLGPGIWASPIQDMAESKLWFPGNWEDMYERVIAYLQEDPTLWSGDQWIHTIVLQISYDGALVLNPGKENAKGNLVVFAGDQPGSFLRRGLGAVIGGGIVFVASLCRALLGKASAIECARDGLAWARTIVEEGYVGPVENNNKAGRWKLKGSTNLCTPNPGKPSSSEIIDYSLERARGTWEEVRNIVCGDNAAVRRSAVLIMGKLITACPDYARTLLRLVGRLENHRKQGNGILSFTIFGGPGSGKSFVAKQLAAAADADGESFEEQSFNISQFGDLSRLTDAFQQIQAIGLRGKIPFVLWDEFDTFFDDKRGGWLQYFLMPMQDALFFDGTTSRALGKCIFAFVGGTFENEGAFKKWALEEDEGKSLKGTDFHSRLDSSITVPPVEIEPPPVQLWDTPDRAKLVRAIMLRAFLQKQKKLQCIARDVLTYLIHVPLEHGVRSLQKIIEASELRRTPVFEAHHLPPADVLELHVKDLGADTTTPVKDFLAKYPGYDKYASKEPLELLWRAKKG